MSLNPLYPLTEDEAAELAACLLTSSTIERYVRCVRTSKATARLSAKVNAPDERELLTYARQYRELMLETPGRNEWELPLAVLMCVLGNSGVAGVDEFLGECVAARKPQAAWVSGLAKILLTGRSGSKLTSTA